MLRDAGFPYEEVRAGDGRGRLRRARALRPPPAPPALRRPGGRPRRGRRPDPDHLPGRLPPRPSAGEARATARHRPRGGRSGAAARRGCRPFLAGLVGPGRLSRCASPTDCPPTGSTCGEEFLGPGAIGELAAAAEAAGFDAVYTTDHPFPGDDWLAHGGHHALDPLVALSFAAAATSTVLLHTNLFVLAYRNPFLAAKGIATLDVLSGGRMVVGLGAGYLEPEFDALGVPFADRNDRMDEAHGRHGGGLDGESRSPATATGFRAPGNTMLPRPRQRPRPPLWIGGNSRRAIRRAVESADGWSPFPNPGPPGRPHPHRAARVGRRPGRRPRLRPASMPTWSAGPSR